MKRPEPFRALFKAAKEQGWSIVTTAGSHIKMISPDGQIVIAPSSPSSPRSSLHLRSQLRRAGLKV